MTTKNKAPHADLSYFRSQVNGATQTVRTYYSVFISICAYLILLVGATSDFDIVMGTQLKLPILGIELPVGGTYFIAPFLVILIHSNLILHIILLAKKVEALKVITDNVFPYKNHCVRAMTMSNQFLILQSIFSKNNRGILSKLLHTVSTTTVFFYQYYY